VYEITKADKKFLGVAKVFMGMPRDPGIIMEPPQPDAQWPN